jgi:D-glycero-alpha-D-manno-heptose-7-phosphate kinase
VTRAIVARAPTRLDFGGGWTDVPPYTEREGGAVCSLAITRYATATAALDQRAARRAGIDAPSNDSLTAAALRRCGIAGAIAHVTGDFPAGAGLGGSSACGVALAGALAMLRGAPLAPNELATLSRATEVEELGVVGGYQDHYAAAYGGPLLLGFAECASVEALTLPGTSADDLVRRSVLLFTGESRLSGSTVAAVRDAYLAGESRTVAALARIKSLAGEMAAALRAGDVDALGVLVGEHWVHQRALHATITTPRIDAIAERAQRAGALGLKALGASGGGCVLAIAENGREEELAAAIAPLGQRLHFGIDHDGFQVIAVLDEQHGDAADR